MRKRARKITLSRETLSRLDNGALSGIQGGFPTNTQCDDTCLTCQASGCSPTCRDWPCESDYCYSMNIWACW